MSLNQLNRYTEARDDQFSRHLYLEEWETDVCEKLLGPGWRRMAISRMHFEAMVSEVRKTQTYKFAKLKNSIRKLGRAIKEALISNLP